MFKDYKEMLKSLQDLQDQMWKSASTSFPESAFPTSLATWQEQTLESMSAWAETAVRHSLDLQREWLDQWTGRGASKKLKPKVFADLAGEARDSMERWLESQYKLWDQWLGVMKGTSGASGAAPDFGAWEQAVRDSVHQQMELLKEWSELTDFSKLTPKESAKLFEHATKSMEKAIETQQGLWSQWFKALGVPVVEVSIFEAPAAAEPAPAKKSKPAPKKAAAPAPASDAHKDLQRISGIGPALAKKLNDAGITNIGQIAALNDEEIASLEERVIRFSGRIKRERWVEQAKELLGAG